MTRKKWKRDKKGHIAITKGSNMRSKSLDMKTMRKARSPDKKRIHEKTDIQGRKESLESQGNQGNKKKKKLLDSP